MAVLFETSVGDFVIDLYTRNSPATSLNFIKLCKAKYYNNNIFHRVIKNLLVQSGDPTGSGEGGRCIFNLIDRTKSRFIKDEIKKKALHKVLKFSFPENFQFGSVCMASAGKNKIASQFFVVTSKKFLTKSTNLQVNF
ncbi:cytochrome P450 monooxygenase 59 [Bonamia ostreae]|uniref:Peptidyl-prolyl cis-trans isomerase n=1 Tax=Bonamia ostreae TaxID=126728 RepID=A0ABV2APB5_9EUKA